MLNRFVDALVTHVISSLTNYLDREHLRRELVKKTDEFIENIKESDYTVHEYILRIVEKEDI